MGQRATSPGESTHEEDIGSPTFLEIIIAGGHEYTGVDCSAASPSGATGGSAGRAEANVGVRNFDLDDAANRRQWCGAADTVAVAVDPLGGTVGSKAHSGHDGVGWGEGGWAKAGEEVRNGEVERWRRIESWRG